ncbi:MAG TPA: hypothetical protein VL495_03120 [Edaphobacter sp.]|nr:hypothetical protein [Edaphobacter sp.]
MSPDFLFWAWDESLGLQGGVAVCGRAGAVIASTAMSGRTRFGIRLIIL